MPKAPNGQKRPADAIGSDVKVMCIATREGTGGAPDDGNDRAAHALDSAAEKRGPRH